MTVLEKPTDTFAVHTARPILSTVNLLHLMTCMRQLDAEGRRQEFWAIWSVVFEVVHLPVPDQVLTNLSLDGIVVPLRRYVCTGFRGLGFRV